MDIRHILYLRTELIDSRTVTYYLLALIIPNKEAALTSEATQQAMDV